MGKSLLKFFQAIWIHPVFARILSQSSVLVVRSFRGADCDTDQYLVIANVRERLAVGKQAAQRFGRQRFNLRKLNEPEVRERYQIEITNRSAALENWTMKRT